MVGMTGTERGKLLNSSLNSFPEDPKHKTYVPACYPFIKTCSLRETSRNFIIYDILKQYATIIEFKLEHFLCEIEQEDIC